MMTMSEPVRHVCILASCHRLFCCNDFLCKMSKCLCQMLSHLSNSTVTNWFCWKYLSNPKEFCHTMSLHISIWNDFTSSNCVSFRFLHRLLAFFCFSLLGKILIHWRDAGDSKCKENWDFQKTPSQKFWQKFLGGWSLLVSLIQGMDMPVDVVVAAHRGRQKSMGSHHSGGICWNTKWRLG